MSGLCRSILNKIFSTVEIASTMVLSNAGDVLPSHAVIPRAARIEAAIRMAPFRISVPHGNRAEDKANVVLTMLKWSCVDTTVVRCGCSSLVGRESRFQPLLPYVSRKLRTDAGVWCPCRRERSLTHLPLST